MWLDPPLQSDFQLNDAITVHMSFADRIARTVVDPDVVNFNYSNPPNSGTTTITYPVGMVRDAVGVYHVDLALNAQGRWVLNAAPQGNPGAVPIGGATMQVRVFGAGT